MSTFNGILLDKKLHFFAIDHFGRHTYHCDYFFLSHHHWDHMDGISQFDFTNLINNSDSKVLYCSPVTANFLKNNPNFKVNHCKVQPMYLDKPLTLMREDVETDVTITSLPANHCAGSVMFLIEYENKRILYTGDIRVTVDNLKKLRGSLSNVDGSAIFVDDLYLDTTFGRPSKYDVIPSRDASIEVMKNLAKQHLQSTPASLLRRHKNRPRVIIWLPSIFGYERLYEALAKAIKMPIEMHHNDFQYFCHVEQMREVLISEYNDGGKSSQIHVCTRKNCTFGDDLRVIRPCAMPFINGEGKNLQIDSTWQVPFYSIGSVIRVFYSTHSSLTELRDICMYLQPKNVIPSVELKEFKVEEMLNFILPKKAVEVNAAAGDSSTSLYRKVMNIPPSGKDKRSKAHREAIAKELGLSDDEDDMIS